MHFFRNILNKFVKWNNWLIIISSLAFIFISAYIFYLIEPGTFNSWFEGVYFVMTTVTTVGYGDISPTTFFGRLFAIFVYIIGIGLIGVVIGKVVDMLSSYRRLKEEGKLKFRGKNHIIIIGWSEKSKMVIDEILTNQKGVEVILIDELETIPVTMERFHYVQGRAVDDDTLEQAGLNQAQAVLVFADGKIQDPQLVDGKTLLIATSIERLASHIYTLVEIVNEAHLKNFKYINIDDFILPNDMLSMLSARAIFNKGITSVTNHLLNRQQGDSLYYLPKIKANWRTYRDAFNELLEQGATLIADEDKLGIHRQLDHELDPSARLCVICSQETYDQLVQNL